MIQTSISGSLAISSNGQNRDVQLYDYSLKHQTKSILFMLVLVFTTMVPYKYCISNPLHQRNQVHHPPQWIAQGVMLPTHL